ncbi:MAG: 2OG-Fe(II) oxygenase [Phenylobacterium sp.]
MNIIPHVVKALSNKTDVYQGAEPFPHIVIENFLPKDVVSRIIKDFPKPESDIWRQRIEDVYQVKLASNNVDAAPECIRSTMYQLNSSSVLKAMENLTGEGPLISDPYYDGGGLHQIQRGGYLAVHSDFTRPTHLPIYRRLNLLIYLNPDWEASYGGNLELWSRDGKSKVREVSPVLNRAVIFTTDTTSFHGHPEPLQCPPDRCRRSLALYYYSVEAPGRLHTGTQTRWRLDAGGNQRGLRARGAAFLWRLSRKLGNMASEWEGPLGPESEERR